MCLGCLQLFAITGGSMVKSPSANTENARDSGSVSGLGWSPGVGNGNPLWDSCLRNPMNRGVWWTIFMGPQRVRHDWAHTYTHTLTKNTMMNFLKHENCQTAFQNSFYHCFRSLSYVHTGKETLAITLTAFIIRKKASLYYLNFHFLF